MKDNVTESKKHSITRSAFFTSILLLSFFVAIYSLVYSGAFVTDDEHIFASRSLSLAFDDKFNLSRVIGNSRVFELSMLPTQQAQEAANVEPAQAFLGALLAKISVFLGVGRVQTMFLLNIWVTALTAVIDRTAETLQTNGIRFSSVIWFRNHRIPIRENFLP
jgi:hypothetical protein